MKKLLIIVGAIVAVFVLIIVLNGQSNKSKLEGANPYDTDDLQSSTINLIGNEHYDNIILPDELAKKIESGEPTTAYFFSPECSYCMEMTPVMMPIAKEMGVEVYQYNVLEYPEQAMPYGIEATPTIIHFKDGEEMGKIVGAQPEKNIRLFFEEHEG